MKLKPIRKTLALAAAFVGLQLFAATAPIVNVDWPMVTVTNTTDNAGGYNWNSKAATLTIPTATGLASGTKVKVKSFMLWSKGDSGTSNTYADTISLTADGTTYTTKLYTANGTGGDNALLYSFPAGKEPTVAVGTTYDLSFTTRSGSWGGVRFRAAQQGSGADGFFKVGTNNEYAPQMVLTAEIVNDQLVTWSKDLANNSAKHGVTMTLGSNAAAASDGTVTLTAKTDGTGNTGVALDWDASTFGSKTMTVLVKYSGMTQSGFTGNTALLATYWGEANKGKEILLNASSTQVKLAYDVTSSASGNNNTYWTKTLPAAGLLRVQYSSAGIHFTFFTGSDGNWTSSVDFNCTTKAELKKDAPFYGLKIGGSIAGMGSYYRPGMTVEGVAVYGKAVSTTDVAKFKFGDENVVGSRVATWNLNLADGSARGDYTMTNDGGTVANGRITTAKTSGSGAYKGVQINWYDATGATALYGDEMAVLVKYSGFSMNSGRTALFSAIWGASKDAKETTVCRTWDGKILLAKEVNSSGWTESGSPMTSGSVAVPTDGLMLITMSGGNATASDNFTAVAFATRNTDGSYGAFSEAVKNTDITYGGGFYGIKVGGTIGPQNHFYRPQMTVEAVTVIQGPFTKDSAALFSMVSALVRSDGIIDYAAAIAGTPATWSTKANMTKTSAADWKNGVCNTIALSNTEVADATLTFDENVTAKSLTLTSDSGKNTTLAKADGATVSIAGYDFSAAAGAVTVFDTGTSQATLPGGITLTQSGSTLTKTAANAITVNGSTMAVTAGSPTFADSTLTSLAASGRNITLTGNNAITDYAFGVSSFTVASGSATFPAKAESNGNLLPVFTVSAGATANFPTLAYSWGTRQLTVNGTLNVAGMLGFQTGSANISLAGSGTVNCGEFKYGNVGKVTVNCARVNIGSSGITKGEANGCTLTFKDGLVLGATADWAMAAAVSVTQNGALTFDTAGHTVTLNGTITGSNAATTKAGDGTLVVKTPNGSYTVNGGTLVQNAPGSGSITVNDGGTFTTTQDISAGAAFKKPTFAANAGSAQFTITMSKADVTSDRKLAIADLGAGIAETTGFNVTIVNADTGNVVENVLSIEDGVLYATAQGSQQSLTLTPTSSGPFNWTVGTAIGDKKFREYDNIAFATTAYTTDVTVPTKIATTRMSVGGVYTFTGSPVIASIVDTLAGADATFSNELVAESVFLTNGTITAESIVASSLTVSNTAFSAKVVGPSMRFVRLKITETQGGGNNCPAVAEFRLYRGSKTTGYTIVDWPKGTKIAQGNGTTFGNPQTKEAEGYPCTVGDSNECRPGCLIDGYYGNSTEVVPYSSPNNQRYAKLNKWWMDGTKGPWVVKIEFPYPVATFSGCNFCLADHAPRNPTAWTIEVSSDGEEWITVADKSGATWSGQYAWCVGEDKPNDVQAENWPAFLNTGTTPATVTVQDGANITADGNWTAALDVSGSITFTGVAGKNLTLDAASTSSFAQGAELTFDLNAYDVSAAGKQYVVAGPTEGWPETSAITVIPDTFTLYKDAEGYYVQVDSGNYWVGDQASGVGTWDFRNTKAWAMNATETTKKDIWLNGVPAFFTRNGTVTIAGDQVQPTAINVTSNDAIAVVFNNAGAIAGVPLNIGSTNVTVTLNHADDMTLTAVTAVADSTPTVVKAGAGTLTVAAGHQFGGGTLKATAGKILMSSTDALAGIATIAAEGTGVIDVNGNGIQRGYTLGTGGTLINGGSAIAYNTAQMNGLTVTGNATIGGDNDFGLIASGYGATTLTLGDNTLAKTGTSSFWLCNTTISGAGTIQIDGGTLAVDSGDAKNVAFADGTIAIGAAGTLRVAANRTLTVGAISGTAGGTLDNSGTISAFTLSGVLTIGNTGTYGTITLADGAVATVGTRRNLTFAGTGKVNVTLTDDDVHGGAELTLFTIASGTPSVGTVTYNDQDITSKCTINGNKVTVNYEAKVGTVYYLTLNEAIQGASEGSTITMLANADVGDTVVTLNNSATLVGGNFTITGAGITAASGKTLTIASGFIGLTALGGTYSLIGGRYASNTKWDAAQGYHYVAFAGTSGGYQIVPGADDPQNPEKAYLVVIDEQSYGMVALNATQLESIGCSTESSAEAVAIALASTETGNENTKFENLVLGLSQTAAASKPVIAPVQTANANQITLKMTGVNVNEATGAKVAYRVYASDTPGGKEGTPSAAVAYNDPNGVSMALPSSGVKYYTIEAIVTPAM